MDEDLKKIEETADQAIKGFEDEIESLKEEKENIFKEQFKTPELEALEKEKREAKRILPVEYPAYMDIVCRLKEIQGLVPYTDFRRQQINMLEKER